MICTCELCVCVCIYIYVCALLVGDMTMHVCRKTL